MRLRFYLFSLMFAILAGLFSDFAAAKGVRVRLGAAGRGLMHSGPKIYSPDVLTVAQLHECLQLEDNINRSANRIDMILTGLSSEKQALEAFSLRLDRESNFLDRYSQASVNAYNNLLSQYREQTARFNLKLPVFNTDVETHNANVNKFSVSCASKKYYETDMDEAKKLASP